MLYEDRSGIIWLNGNLVPWRQAETHVLTHTLHYGTGVFEGLRAYKTARGTCAFRLTEHTERLFRSAEIVRMKIPFSLDEIMRAQCEVVRENELDEAYIRPIVFFDSKEMGLHADHLGVQVAIAAWEWPRYLGDDSHQSGISMKTVSLRRMADSPLNEAKASGPYLISVMAVREATEAGADEALLLDQHGRVAEGSGQNIFLVRDGALQTPLGDNCLAGITRASVMDLAVEMGLKVEEKHLLPEDLLAADELFVTGSATEVAPVSKLDGQSIGNGQRGPVTERLQTVFTAQVRGERDSFPDWLTPVGDPS